MLEAQNNLYKKSINRKFSKKKNFEKTNCYLAAEYLSEKFVNLYNLKDLNSNISEHLIKIFVHFLRHNSQNIDLIKLYSKNKLKSLEFRVNILNNSSKIKKNSREEIEIISVKNFFNDNIKYILI